MEIEDRIKKMLEAAKKLVHFLDDPKPGFSTWYGVVDRQITAINAAWSDEPAEPHTAKPSNKVYKLEFFQYEPAAGLIGIHGICRSFRLDNTDNDLDALQKAAEFLNQQAERIVSVTSAGKSSAENSIRFLIVTETIKA